MSPESDAMGTMPAQSPRPAARFLRYALVTPARNEEKFIEGTIKAVVAQTVLPARWVIVSDGSTDRTDEIIARYAAVHPWIDTLRMPDRRDRQFAAKANSFNAGLARLKGVAMDVIGNLDADITFEPAYIEFLLQKFAEMPKLGVAGTPFTENFSNPGDHSYAHGFANTTHVSGACQLFRLACFQEVGGYVPVEGGAIDWIAVTTARMRGWQTRTFNEKVCFHHRELGTGSHSPLKARFHYGWKAYYVGGHPLWELCRGVFQMRQKPYVVGGALFIAGYLWAFLRRTPRVVTHELMAFHRAEQMARLRRVFKRTSKASRGS
jgi:glycosyltransferase involved in cell wall biosynthesis